MVATGTRSIGYSSCCLSCLASAPACAIARGRGEKHTATTSEIAAINACAADVSLVGASISTTS